MSEKPLSVESLQGIDSASEISHVLSYARQRAAVDLEILDEEASQKHVRHHDLGDTPDGGLRAWLVVLGRVHFQSIEQSTDMTSSGCSAALVMFST